MLAIGTSSMRALVRSIARKISGLEAEKVVNTPVSSGMVRARAIISPCRREHAQHAGVDPLLQLDLEAAGAADAAHRGRRDRDDECLLDRLQPGEELADEPGAGLAMAQTLVERRVAGEDRGGVRGVGEGGAGKPGKGHGIDDARRILDDLGGALHHRVGARQEAPSGSWMTTMA